MSSGTRPRILTVSEGGWSATVMVGPVRGPAHHEVIHRFGYYHVPVSSIAPSRVAVAFIAFYEGASQFRTAVGHVREFAGVLRVARVLRRDLPGLTWAGRTGDDAPYYRFDLGPIRALPRPITNPDRIRLLFRYVDIAELERADSIRSLGKSTALIEAQGPRLKIRGSKSARPSAKPPAI